MCNSTLNSQYCKKCEIYWILRIWKQKHKNQLFVIQRLLTMKNYLTEKSVIEWRKRSFSHLSEEKSNSTAAVCGKMETKSLASPRFLFVLLSRQCIMYHMFSAWCITCCRENASRYITWLDLEVCVCGVRGGSVFNNRRPTGPVWTLSSFRLVACLSTDPVVIVGLVYEDGQQWLGAMLVVHQLLTNSRGELILDLEAALSKHKTAVYMSWKDIKQWRWSSS